MSKIMLVTVGTSLFHSASWEFDDWVKDQIPEYEKWRDPGEWGSRPGPLISADERLKIDGSKIIINHLTSNLNVNNATEWATHFVKTIQQKEVMRYSAELSTLFELGLTMPPKNLEKYLDQFRGNIYFIADPNLDQDGKYDDQYIAATHLKEYLNSTFSNSNAEILKIQKLSSKNPQELLGNDYSGINLMIQRINREIENDIITEIIIIASGGYKTYGPFFGTFLFSDKLSIVYRHEKGDEVLIIKNDKIIATKSGKKYETQIPRIKKEPGGLEG